MIHQGSYRTICALLGSTRLVWLKVRAAAGAPAVVHGSSKPCRMQLFPPRYSARDPRSSPHRACHLRLPDAHPTEHTAYIFGSSEALSETVEQRGTFGNEEECESALAASGSLRRQTLLPALEAQPAKIDCCNRLCAAGWSAVIASQENRTRARPPPHDGCQADARTGRECYAKDEGRRTRQCRRRATRRILSGMPRCEQTLLNTAPRQRRCRPRTTLRGRLRIHLGDLDDRLVHRL
jgi:hypothetical protein